MLAGGRRARGRPILVTGTYRSGSTWVGRMLALSPRVAYINEPFNPTHSPGVCAAAFPLRYQYIHSGNEGRFRPPLAATLSFRYQYRAQIPSLRSRTDIEQLVRDGWAFARARLRKAQPVVKDPFAAFSAGWLSTTFDMGVVVVVRHPAAYAASIKRLGWRPEFDELLAQPRLIHDQLGEYEAAMISMRARADLIDQAGLMWLMVYSTLLRLGHEHPDWVFVRHEDLAANPLARFPELYGAVALTWTPEVGRQVQWYSNARVSKEGEIDPYDYRRRSRDTIGRWREETTDSDRDRLRGLVESVSGQFYSDEDW
jgi:hypothetical protein